MKTLSRLLLILLFAIAQIPVLPVTALVIAQNDNGHQICLSEEEGVVKMVLRHDKVHTLHQGALDILIRLEANNDNTQDHVMNFVHSELPYESFRSPFDQNVLASCEAWIAGDEIIIVIGDEPLVAEEIPVEWSRADHTRVPLGLTQTVILV
jgi:hypothetical protein